MKVVVRACSDRGMKREQNEDCHAVWIPEDPDELARRGALLIVADGMGGSRAGEVASRIATDTVMDAYRGADSNPPDEILRASIEEANARIHESSLSNPDHGGMGTTCTACVVRDGDLFIGHVGDSRAYLVRRGDIRQLTDDHSLVAQLVRDHQITAEQARVDPRRNVVTRSVGVAEHIEVDARREGPLRTGDTVVLCSDGLSGVVEDREIAEVASKSSLDGSCKKLIELANSRGGPDNITVIIARLEDLKDTAEIPRIEEA